MEFKVLFIFRISHTRLNAWDNAEKIALEKVTYPSEEDPTNPLKRKQIKPIINYIKTWTDVGVSLVPIYGKVSFFSKFIVYSDLFGRNGVSIMV